MRHRTLKKSLAVIPQKFPVRLGQLFRQRDRLALIRQKVLFQGGLGKEFTETVAQNNLEILVERNQPIVEGRVMERRKAESIARIQALSGEFAPWFDVARNQKARNIDSANAATDVVRVEDGLTKKLLATPDLDRCL